MQNYTKQYFERITAIQTQVMAQELDNIESAGKLFADTIEKGNAIYAFGASHAGILAEEMFYRTGGLALVNPIFSPTLMLNTRPVNVTSQMERVDGFGRVIFEGSKARAGDTILLHSVSGRNTVSIDMAEAAREAGLNIVVVTNMTYTKGVTSRHKSGKNLYQYADILIDNHGDFEDSAIELHGMGQKSGATSSVVGCMIVNMVLLSAIGHLQDKGIDPPVFRSANVDGGDAFNARIFEQYKDQIHYM